jgi:hypothetical protein
MKTLGSHHKEMKWILRAGTETTPIEVRVTVDQSALGSAKVGVVFGVDETGKPLQVFPPLGPNSHATGKLNEDFHWSLKFYGSLKNLGKKGFYEVRQMEQGCERWYPATVVRQHRADLVEAVLHLPTQSGESRECSFPLVPLTDVRDFASKEPIALPERVLSIEVPKANPLHALLAVDGEPCTHFFGRPTPAPSRAGSQDDQVLRLKVDQERQNCTGNFGALVLEDFLRVPPQLVKAPEASKQKCSWSVALGHFADHVFEIEKQYKTKTLTLTVDGKCLADATAEELDCAGSEWECKFRLMGERTLEFEVHETNADGDALDSTGVVPYTVKVDKEVVIKVPDDKDFTTATLTVGGISPMDMRQKTIQAKGETVQVSPQGLFSTYNISVPNKVNADAATGFSAVGRSILNAGVNSANLLYHSSLGNSIREASKENNSALFGWCMTANTVVDESTSTEIKQPSDAKLLTPILVN